MNSDLRAVSERVSQLRCFGHRVMSKRGDWTEHGIGEKTVARHGIGEKTGL